MRRGSLPPLGNSTPLLTSTPNGASVVWAQAAGHQTTRAYRVQRRPIELDAGTTWQTLRVRVEQVALSAQRVRGHHFGGDRFVTGADVQGLDRRTRHPGNELGRLVAG